MPPPGENWYVFKMTMLGVGVSIVIFWVIRQFARPPPKTMNAQWQAMTNEYLRVRTDISSTGMPQAQTIQNLLWVT